MEKERRPLREALPAADSLMAEIGPFCARAEIAGSVRRRRDLVGDIEVVAVPRTAERPGEPDLFLPGGTPRPPANLLWEKLDGMGLDTIKAGPKYRQFVWRGWKVDLFTAAPGSFGWIFLVRTGSQEFSHAMASQLNRKGLTSAGGWIQTRAGRRIETPEEEDVFRLSGTKFVPPEGRQTW